MKKNMTAIIAGVCALALGAGLVTNFVMDENRVTTKTLGASAYQAAIVKTDGTIDKEDHSKIVSNLTNADGVTVSYGEGATVEYCFHWYDEHNVYLSSSETMTSDFDGEKPENAAKMRVEITPVGDEDGEVSIFELPGYVSQIEVTVNK